MADRGEATRRWLLLAVALAALAIGLWCGPQPLDDAFITLRYARSLAHGEGFVFNPGEHVLGTTTPLFTLLLGGLHWLTSIDLVWLAFALALAAHIATVVLVADIGTRSGFAGTGTLAAAMYAIAPMAWGATLGCMETPLFILASMYALAGPGRPAALSRGGAAAVSMLTRPEGGLVALLYLLQVAWVDKRSAPRAAAAVIVLVAPWLIFATWYFGSPVPQSLLTKWGERSLTIPWLATENFMFTILSVVFSLPLMSHALEAMYPLPFGTLVIRHLAIFGNPAVDVVAVQCLAVAIVVVIAIGSIALIRRNRDVFWLQAFACAYVVAFCLADPHMFAWYLVPPLPIFELTFVVGGGVLLHNILSTPRWASSVGAIVALVLLVTAARNTAALLEGLPSPRELAYQKAVEAVGPAAQDPHTLIGALEIGAIGYYARARVLDHYGLVSPEVPKLGIAAAIERFHPDYYIGQALLMALSGFPLVPEFTQQYRRITTVALPNAGLTAADVFVRREHDPQLERPR